MQGIPVQAGRFHRNPRLASRGGRNENLAFELIDALSIILKRFECRNDETFRCHGGRGMFTFANVNPNDIPVINKNGVGSGSM